MNQKATIIALQKKALEAHNRSDLVSAKKHFNEILSIAPQHETTLNYLASIEAMSGNIESSEKLFRRAIALSPGNYKYYNNLGYALEINKRYSDAISVLQEALAINPAYPSALLNLGNAYKGIGDLEQAYMRYKQSLELQNDNFIACSNLLYISNTLPRLSNSDVYELHKSSISVFANKIKTSGINRRKNTDRKIRIGYLSSDFREHSCSYFIEPVLQMHNHDEFEIYAYYNYHITDTTTHRIQEYSDHWRMSAGLDHTSIADMIMRDEIDILIELSGYTANSALLSLTHQPAPVMISWIGYPNTTGLNGNIYRVVDHHVDPEGASDRYHSETLIRMPDTFLVYKPPEETPETTAPPVSSNGYITFGSFNNDVKINEYVISAWASILNEVENSRLILKSAGLDSPERRKQIKNMFSSSGVDEARINLLGKEPSTFSHLSRYAEIDIAMDTFPYNGTTTTFESLWMGVPVICLAGDNHRSRVGYSILKNLHLEEWIADDMDGYIKIAKKMAQEKDDLVDIRKSMRQHLIKSKLMDNRGFTLELEAQFKHLWGDWCKRQP